MTDTNVTYTNNIDDSFLEATDKVAFTEQTGQLSNRLQREYLKIHPYVYNDKGEISIEGTTNIYATPLAAGIINAIPALNIAVCERFAKSGVFIDHVNLNHVPNFVIGKWNHIEFGITLPWFAANLKDINRGVMWNDLWRFYKTGTFGGLFVYRGDKPDTYRLSVHT